MALLGHGAAPAAGCNASRAQRHDYDESGTCTPPLHEQGVALYTTESPQMHTHPAELKGSVHPYVHACAKMRRML